MSLKKTSRMTVVPAAQMDWLMDLPAQGLTAAQTVQWLNLWTGQGLLRHIDSAFAAQVLRLDAHASPALLVAAAVLAHMEGRGHTCLSVAELCQPPVALLGWPAAAVEGAQGLKALWAHLPTTLADWRQALQADLPCACVRLGVGHFGVGHKKTVQPFACRRFGHGQWLAGALQQALAHALLVARITAQVQKRCIGRTAQHHRLTLVGGIGKPQTNRRRVALQSSLPIGQRGGQVRPQSLQALSTVHSRRRPAQQRHGGLAQLGHGQAGVATAFHVGEHGRSHQQLGAGVGIEAQHLRRESTVDVAQQALASPQIQPLQSLRCAQALGRQVHEPVHLRGGHGRHA